MDDQYPEQPTGRDLDEGAVARTDEGRGTVRDDDPLLAVRARLDEVDQLSLDDRAEVFEQTHRVVVDELRALELG